MSESSGTENTSGQPGADLGHTNIPDEAASSESELSLSEQVAQRESGDEQDSE